ncbi:MAG: ribosome small subunit-dependent GTPase A [Sedimentisphaerales bacterium]|nr:ribosome small subunit-dependent GTPase A [Sedimentisphaerales bacterium]
MHKSDKKRLEEKLATLSDSERRRLYRLAAKKRKAALAQHRSRPSDLTQRYRNGKFDGSGGQSMEKRSHRPVTLDEWILKILEKQESDIAEITPEEPAECRNGTVISVKAATCQILDEHQMVDCILRPELTVAQRSDLAVGDRVDYSESEDGTHIIERVHPRRSVLSRPDPHDPRIERIIAANIDLAVIVASVKAPPFNSNLIDRYLLAIECGGITPFICINKSDLLPSSTADEESIAQKIEQYHKLDIDAVFCSALTGEGISDLLGRLSGKVCVFVGHSGVGKTSLLNTMNPDLALPIGSIRDKSQKGRHTTVTSTLYELDNDIRIIDTPGIRGFGLWRMSPEELRWYFSEFDEFSPHCKFSDCSHIHEPHCAVKEAVEQNKINPVRYQSYQRIYESLEH